MSRFDYHGQPETQIIYNKTEENTQERISKLRLLQFYIGWQKVGNILAVRNQIAGYGGRNVRVG